MTAALLGVAAGMRSMVPLAALSLTRSRRRLVRVPATLGAAGEIIYDKIPSAGDRTEPAPLIARVGSGALAGAVGARAPGEPILLPAAAGALAAGIATLVFHRLRAALAARVRPVLAAVAEDLLAAGVAAAALRLPGTSSPPPVVT